MSMRSVMIMPIVMVSTMLVAYGHGLALEAMYMVMYAVMRIVMSTDTVGDVAMVMVMPLAVVCVVTTVIVM